MHLIQFPLQVFKLLLDGGFLVDILVFLLVGGIGVIGNLGHLQELVDQLLHKLRPAKGTVFRQDLIVFLVGRLHPDGEHSRQRPQRIHMFHIGRRGRTPLIALGEFFHGFLCRDEFFLRHIIGHVLDICPAARHQGDRMVPIDHHALDVHSRRGLDVHSRRGVNHRVAVIADLRDRPQQSDRVEAVLCPLRLALVLPGNQQDHLFIDPHVPGEVTELVSAKINIRIRRNQLVIYRNNCHTNLPP